MSIISSFPLSGLIKQLAGDTSNFAKKDFIVNEISPGECKARFKTSCIKKRRLIDFSNTRIRRANPSAAGLQKEETQRLCNPVL